MDGILFDGHDELYHHAKFQKDRTMLAGCRRENVVFFFVFVTAGIRFTQSSKNQVAPIQVKI